MGKFADLTSTHQPFSGSRVLRLCVPCRAATRIQLGVPARLAHQVLMPVQEHLSVEFLPQVCRQAVTLRQVLICSIFRRHLLRIRHRTVSTWRTRRHQTQWIRTITHPAVPTQKNRSLHSRTHKITLWRQCRQVLQRTVCIVNLIICRHIQRMFQHRTLRMELLVFTMLV